MASAAYTAVGMLLLGIAIGQYIPPFPEPLGFLDVYFGFILIIAAVLLLVKG